MLSINAISDADYYLRAGSGCGGSGSGGSAADYELEAVAAGEPPGEWHYPHRNDLGVAGEIHAEGPSGDAFRAVVNELRHPVTGEQLGRAPAHYATVEERLERFRLRHPEATAEQIAEQRIRAASNSAKANHAWDLTFSAPKSWSVLHAALEREGRHDEAEQVWAALRAGIDAAIGYAADELGHTRRGVTGPKVAGRQTMRHVRDSEFQTAVFRHHTSRDRDPQLHAHVMLVNRVLCEDGQWRALFSPAILKSKHLLDAIFLRVAETELTQRLGTRFAARPDGKAREVVGVSPEIRDLFSARTRALTEEAQQEVDRYTAETGHAPSRLVQWRIQQRATLRSRKAKPKGGEVPTREEDVARWDEEVAREFREGFAAVVEETDLAATRPAPDSDFDPDAVIGLALHDLSQRKATWNRSHLMHAINAHLPDMLALEPARVPELLTELTEAALAGRQVVSLSAPSVVPVPASLLDEKSGESVFEAPTGGRYTARLHLDREDSLVARLAHRGAPALTPESATDVLTEHGLSVEQLSVATAILTSDRKVEVVNAAAGTGKSRLMAALSETSAEVWGHGLTGFSTAENAAQVLRREGVERAHNIAAFLDFRDRSRRGETSPLDEARFAVPAGGTVVVDEASMVSTPHLTALLGELEQMDVGRVVLIGDTAQVDAVDAGGGFALLCDERTPHTLTEVRRFTNEWERNASAQLRDGDLSALTQYDARNRVQGGDPESVAERAVQAFVTDHLSGQETVLVVSTGEQAAELSSEIRARLVQAGHVVEAGVQLHDKTTAGPGDLVQTRLNQTRTVGVVNREVWRVLAADEDTGTLRVQSVEDGQVLRTLPAEYVNRYVELAYASTIEAVQGRTTDTGHLLVDEMMGRSRAYPGLTRGREANTAWVSIGPPTRRLRESDAEYEARIPSPLSVMVQAFEREDHTEAARQVIAAEQARATHLGNLGPQWSQLVAEHRAVDHRDLLAARLGTDRYAVMADPAVDGVLHLLRSAESHGYDLDGVVTTAVAETRFEGARSPAALLYDRLDATLQTAKPATQVERAESYAERTPAGEGERTEYARGVAEAMDARTAELGEQAAVEPPAWALALLGPVPAEPLARVDWSGKAALVSAYREQYGWSSDKDVLGPAPSRAEPEKRWAWARASDALGPGARDRDTAEADEYTLAQRVLEWRRDQEWMPRNVDDDLRDAHKALEVLKQEIVEMRTRGEDPAESVRMLREQEARAARLETVASGRKVAVEKTAETRDRAQEALLELERRVARDRVVAERAAAKEAEQEASRGRAADESARIHEAVGERFREQYVEQAPVFGSPRWAELGDDEPAKRSSLFTAALSWWRAGSPRDEQELTDRLERHGADVAPEYSLSARGLDRVRAGEDEREVRETEPSGELETLVELHRYTAPELEGDAPEFGSPDYAEAEPEKQGKAEARAALRWLSTGDDLDERARRADDLDERQASKAISEKMQETRHPFDERSHAEVLEARGETPPERETPEPEVEPEPTLGPAHPDTSWIREQPDEPELPEPQPALRDDIAEQLARARDVLDQSARDEQEREPAAPEPAPPVREDAER